MRDFVTTKGIVLRTSNLGEYDRRMVVLTQDFGKITVFCRGVRRPKSKYIALATPFTFGVIKAFPGNDAYSLMEIELMDYFEPLRKDFELSCLGMYFLEVADYYCRENNDELMMLKLLYVSLRCLEKKAEGKLDIPFELIRAVYEIRAIAVNGEFPGILPQFKLSEAASYTLEYIASQKLESLYSFKVSDEVLSEVVNASKVYRNRFLCGNFKSLDIILT